MVREFPGVAELGLASITTDMAFSGILFRARNFARITGISRITEIRRIREVSHSVDFGRFQSPRYSLVYYLEHEISLK